MADLSVAGVSKEFPTRDEPLVVLRDVSLNLSLGENVAVLGPSGSGKSTLLHVIGALDPPTSGAVELGGRNPYELAEPQLADFRNQEIGFVFQDHHLLPQLSMTAIYFRGRKAPGRGVPANRSIRIGAGGDTRPVPQKRSSTETDTPSQLQIC